MYWYMGVVLSPWHFNATNIKYACVLCTLDTTKIFISTAYDQNRFMHASTKLSTEYSNR